MLAACGPAAPPGGSSGPKTGGRDAGAGVPSEIEPGSASTATEPNGWTWSLPAGISTAPIVPADNPMTQEKVALGHRLFMDKRLSVDGTRSCYSCHQNQLGAADGRPLALGPGGKVVPRNTPTIWNVGLRSEWYWDGRAPTLEKQMLGAWKGGNMGVGEDGLASKAKEIGALTEYAAEFRAVFALAPDADVTPEHVAMAVSAYERTLLCGDTAFDRGQASEAARRGWDIFRGKAQCTACHYDALFTDHAFHNVGIGLLTAEGPVPEPDVGRFAVTKAEEDKYRFRTPSLRNVARTAPYFHDGSVATLREAVVVMARGGVAGAPGLDPLLLDKKLSDDEIDDVVAFLELLDCPGELEVLGDQAVPDLAIAPAQ